MSRLVITLITFFLLAACAHPGPERAPLTAAPSVDLPCFMGTWHVIAHVPCFFEAGKIATHDEYSLRPDGRIDNDFVFKKRFGEANQRWRGISTVVPDSGGARWKVQFVWPFSTELVVVHIDDDYQAAALATPDRKLAWIFGRDPTLAPARYAAMVSALAAQGVDAAALQPVAQLAPES